eukprot:TRINITY_DN122666_c0_g1_i1.p1 TRINITY_DN122666_c0_g1~~TRINITY_DN122666_c0_g1_i1.p1  ORF type:complete len:345 (+),score=60.37 TRINITY_DN122666_c0_g1_i1:58-1092(+)
MRQFRLPAARLLQPLPQTRLRLASSEAFLSSGSRRAACFARPAVRIHAAAWQHAAGRHSSSSSAIAPSGLGAGLAGMFRKAPPPDRVIVELASPAKLLADPEADSEAVLELPAGELLEAFGDVDSDREWLLVRSPLEDDVELMSDKPLAYQDGWLHDADVKKTSFQLGDTVTARTESDIHPAFEAMRLVPPWRPGAAGGGAPIPDWIRRSVNELYNGKVAGVTKNGRFLVQRPAGAMPERVVTTADFLYTPKERKRRAIAAGIIGLAVSAVIGVSVHGYSWLRGEKFQTGRMSWPNLVGWLCIVSVVVVPFTIWPCYLCSNSQASTVVVVAWLNLLFYNDLFGE